CSEVGCTRPHMPAYPSPWATGLTLDTHGGRTISKRVTLRVTRLEKNGVLTVLADRYEGKRLNSPHDLVYRSDGTLYFTDPPFGLLGRSGDPSKELPFGGVFRVHDGTVLLVTAELSEPTGIALSPDEHYLYVGNGDPARRVVMRYTLGDTGRATGSGVFCDMTGAEGGDAIGGIKVDTAGHVYVCGPSGIWLLSPSGEYLGILRLPENPHNLTWGDEDARTLYVTALTSVYRIRLAIPGVRPR